MTSYALEQASASKAHAGQAGSVVESTTSDTGHGGGDDDAGQARLVKCTTSYALEQAPASKGDARQG